VRQRKLPYLADTRKSRSFLRKIDTKNIIRMEETRTSENIMDRQYTDVDWMKFRTGEEACVMEENRVVALYRRVE